MPGKASPTPRQKGLGPWSQRPLVNLQVLDQRPDYLWGTPRQKPACVRRGGSWGERDGDRPSSREDTATLPTSSAQPPREAGHVVVRDFI